MLGNGELNVDVARCSIAGSVVPSKHNSDAAGRLVHGAAGLLWRRAHGSIDAVGVFSFRASMVGLGLVVDAPGQHLDETVVGPRRVVAGDRHGDVQFVNLTAGDETALGESHVLTANASADRGANRGDVVIDDVLRFSAAELKALVGPADLDVATGGVLPFHIGGVRGALAALELADLLDWLRSREDQEWGNSEGKSLGIHGCGRLRGGFYREWYGMF